MRTVLRLCLVGALVASVGLAAVPIAEAKKARTSHHADAKQNKKIRKAKRKANRAHTRIENLKEWNFVLDDHNRRQDASFNTLQGLVNAIIAGVPDIVGGLEALEEGLLAVDAALNDETTGLVGLNLARPQFGVYDGAGAFLGGTGDAGGSGPIDEPASASGGLYVVDFHNDVSDRMYSVNVFPPVLAAVPTGGAVNCDASASIEPACDSVEADSGGDPTKVLVQIGDGSSAAPAGFSVTALSG